MNALQLTIKSLREKGVTRTALIIFSHIRDLSFDFKYKTDTTSWTELQDLATLGDNKDHGFRYQPAQERSLRKVLREMRFPTDGAFVDIGSGKGRVLMIASDYGFKRVIGVEFSDLLCGIARKNLALYSQARSRELEYQIHHADAAAFAIPDDVSLVFMNNPFDETVMRPVIANIVASLARKPREIHVVYSNPTCRALFDANDKFRVIGEYPTAQLVYLIYRAGSTG